MKKERYAIPEGCQSITVESDSDKLLIRFGRLDPGEFRSELTDSLERAPIVGNVAIFWNDEARKQAVKPSREMHKTVCASCGGEAVIPFKPMEGKDYYCSECFAKRKEQGLA